MCIRDRDRAVGPDAVTKIKRAGDLVRGYIDNSHGGTIGAGFRDSGVAVDGDEGGLAIGSGHDFVASDAADRDRRDLFIGGGVDDAEGAISLVGDEYRWRVHDFRSVERDERESGAREYEGDQEADSHGVMRVSR